LDKGKVFKTAIGIFIIVTLSKTLGFFREMLVAYRFGSGSTTDAFYVSDSINSVIFRLAGAGLGLAVIPVLAKIKQEQSEKHVKQYTWTLCVLFSAIAIVLMVFTLIFTEPIVHVFALGFTGERLELAIRLTRIGIPIIFFNFLYAIFEAYNQSNERFFIPASSGLFLNIPIIGYLVFYHDRMGLEGLILSMVIGYGLRSLYLYLPIHKDRIIGNRISIKDKYLKMTMGIMFPIMLSSIINYINIIVDKTLASRLVPGSISALSYAHRTTAAIDMIFIASMVTVIYPQFSQAVSIDNQERLKRMFTYGLNSILLIVIPAMIGVMILHEELIRVIFKRGAFDEVAVGMTASALFFYSLGILARGINLFINKIYYSFHDSRTTMKIGVATVGLNIILNIILVRVMAHNGLALATSIVLTLGMLVKLYFLKNKPLIIEYRKIITTGLKALVASGVMGTVLYLIMASQWFVFEGIAILQFAKLIAICLICVAVYGFMVYLLRVEVVRELTEKIHERIVKSFKG
jgi:putative peptidoglycan lipid II flippase